jgi:hypothetical protein
VPGEKLTGLDVSNVGYGGGHDGYSTMFVFCFVCFQRS